MQVHVSVYAMCPRAGIDLADVGQTLVREAAVHPVHRLPTLGAGVTPHAEVLGDDLDKYVGR